MALHPPQGDKLICMSQKAMSKFNAFFLIVSLCLPIVAPGESNGGQAAQFTLGTLSRAQLDSSSPIPQFHKWFSEAQDAIQKQGIHGAAVAEACTLSTAELPSGRVSSRMVYLKELDAQGYVVYSNFGTSKKAADLATNGHAALCFYWPALQRQVRVEGVASRLSKEESQVYFDTRARGSRIGAWSSMQSAVLVPEDGGVDDGRAQLEGWVAETEKRFDGQDEIPVPEFWGGLRIVPTMVEFWQGRDSRLHDRFAYEREDANGKWVLSRLSP